MLREIGAFLTHPKWGFMKNGLSGLPHAPGSRYEMRLISPILTSFQLGRNSPHGICNSAPCQLISWCFPCDFLAKHWRKPTSTWNWTVWLLHIFPATRNMPSSGGMNQPLHFTTISILVCNHRRPLLAKAAQKIFWIALSYKKQKHPKKNKRFGKRNRFIVGKHPPILF